MWFKSVAKHGNHINLRCAWIRLFHDLFKLFSNVTGNHFHGYKHCIHGNGHSNGFSQIQMQFPQQIQSLLSAIITTLARSWRGWKEQKAVLGLPANATGSCTIWQTPCTLLMYLPLCHAQCPGLTRVGSIPGQLPHTSATGPITSWISLEKLVRFKIVISKRVVLDACCG